MQSILDMTQQHFGRQVRWCLYDLTLPKGEGAVDVRNGEGLADPGPLEPADRRFNHVAQAQDGRHFRSSFLPLEDGAGRLCAGLLINEDITALCEAEQLLARCDPHLAAENLHVGELLDVLLQEAAHEVGKPFEAMDKPEKQRVIAFLDAHGAFRVTKSGQVVCDALKISKYTLYNYLDATRRNKPMPAKHREAER